ncbi:MAG: hypothetical protein ACYDH5_15300 [Acidimicrobiales bacterium]
MGDEPGGAEEFDLLAASLRADASDLGTFVEVLASKLEDALPGQVTVRRPSGLFNRDHRVASVTVEAGKERFELERSRSGGMVASVAKSVRGITLKTEQTGLDEWITRLAAALAEQTRAMDAGRAALQRLIE